MSLPQEKQAAPAVIDILPINMEAEIQKAKQARVALDKLFDELLVPGTDFDRVPGTDKPTLLKPGAELLCQVFHLAPGKPEIVSQQEDFQTGVFSYTVVVPIHHRETGILVACGIGSANSKEPKYRYRKKTEGGEEIRIENPDPAGEQNTLIKMASKRALVDGVLKATGASRKFTQDAEDLMPPEKASSKQLSYVKILLKGKKEPDMFAEIGKVLGREVKEWDLTREEASRFIEAKKGETKKDSNGSANGKQAKSGGLNWSAFWAKTRELNLERDRVHELAGQYFTTDINNPREVNHLNDVIKSQADLDGFLSWMQGTKLGGDGAAAEAS